MGRDEQDLGPRGLTAETRLHRDHGEESYVGSARLAGRRTLIVGGDAGVARAIAIAFAREGADVVMADVLDDAQDAATTLDWIEQAGVRALRLPGQVRDEASAQVLVARVVEEFGGLDVLVLSATEPSAREGLAGIEREGLRRVIDGNLLVPTCSAAAAIPYLGSGASIIVLTSIQAIGPAPELVDAAMANAALLAFMRTLVAELGPSGVRVNAVTPGQIWAARSPTTEGHEPVRESSRATPLGRAGQPAEVAPAVVFLASTEASYVSGAIVPVSGGRSL